MHQLGIYSYFVKLFLVHIVNCDVKSVHRQMTLQCHKAVPDISQYNNMYTAFSFDQKQIETRSYSIQ